MERERERGQCTCMLNFVDFLWLICYIFFMEEALKRLGKGIRQKRKAKGLSQKALAERVSVHPTHLSRIERGETNPTIIILSRISEELGAPIDQWLKVEKKGEEDEAIALIQKLKPQSLRLFVSILKEVLEWQKDLEKGH